jgi:hypothetical protein
MRGSIAIWRDAEFIKASGYAPKVEAHINIWRNSLRKPGRHDLLDVGILFQEVRALCSLSISLPFKVKAGQVSDLFEVMNDDTTLSAIFNETLEARGTSRSEDGFEAFHTERSCVQCFVHRCRAERDWTLKELQDEDDTCSVIVIRPGFFKRLREVGDHYVRLRIEVPIDQPNGFVSTINPEDSAFVSTISTSEIVEIRLNEMRNFSPALRRELKEESRELIDISAVHYFLIRDMSVEMTQSHMTFRKMRRLEPKIWDKYLAGHGGFRAPDLIIYHWASFAKSNTEPVDSFTALATFRAYYTGSLLKYALVIIALGALGSALQGWGTEVLKAVLPESWAAYGAFLANVVLFGLLSFTLWLFVKFKKNRR